MDEKKETVFSQFLRVNISVTESHRTCICYITPSTNEKKEEDIRMDWEERKEGETHTTEGGHVHTGRTPYIDPGSWRGCLGGRPSRCGSA